MGLGPPSRPSRAALPQVPCHLRCTHSSWRRRLSWALVLASCRAKWCEGPSRGVLAGASGNRGADSRSSSSSTSLCGRSRAGSEVTYPMPPTSAPNHHKLNLAFAALLAQDSQPEPTPGPQPPYLNPCEPPIPPSGPRCLCCPLPGPPHHAPVPVSIVSPSGSWTASPALEVPAPQAQAQPAPAPCPPRAGSPE